MTTAPSDKFSPIIFVAALMMVKSGLFVSLIGVGTVTTIILASFKSDSAVVNWIFADSISEDSISNVIQGWCFLITSIPSTISIGISSMYELIFPYLLISIEFEKPDEPEEPYESPEFGKSGESNEYGEIVEYGKSSNFWQNY